MEAKIKEKEREQQEEKNEKIKEKKAEEAVETVETEPAPPKEISGDIKVEVHATAVHHDQQLEPKIAHAQTHEISHSQATYSVRRVEMPENRSVYVTLAFAGVALMVAMLIGVVVLKKRSSRYPHHQLVSVQTAKIGKTKEGFIEVDTAASPEEKHVANMQINGYENPTYKYFEASTA